ncbi:unnamed protein product [Chironomus riparius]|uniref:F-box domain-containing protein n=1 Tax=Chironomus riparius TaxID=315576 RepID=A0A9N9SBX7_9DIPT|nr:unnamed protein product [Chironomus riparius]
MSHENLSIFPQEILIHIFSYLPSSDLISLSETCASFHCAINSCNALMRKFKIFIFDHKKSFEWTPTRKYIKISIDSQSFEDYLKIFEYVGSDLEVLEIRYSSFDLKVLREILLMCENVKEIYIQAISLTVYLSDPIEPMPSLTLKKFFFLNLEPESIDVLKIFHNSSIADVEMIGNFKRPQILKTFLSSQTDLKKFHLHNKLDVLLLFDDNSLSNPSFKLQSLKLDNFDLYTQLPFFSNFIRSQSESLEIFETNQWKVFNLLGNLKNLKTVTIPSMRFTNPEPFRTVENLTINVDVSEGWARQFPNVKNLKLHQMSDYEYNTTAEAQTFSSLEDLEIQYNTVVDLNIPTVKRLKLCYLSKLEAGRPFDYENCKKLEELTIIRCSDAEWLAEYLERVETKLRLLVIQSTKLSECCLGVIEKNRQKIENLEIF